MIKLYPSVQVARQSFAGVKRCTVPNQSLSLREIVKRFVRRESLPLSVPGVYEERFGDLEKLSKADIFDQMERVKELKAQIADFNKRSMERAQADAAAKAKASAPVAGIPGSGEPPVKIPPIGA